MLRSRVLDPFFSGALSFMINACCLVRNSVRDFEIYALRACALYALRAFELYVLCDLKLYACIYIYIYI